MTSAWVYALSFTNLRYAGSSISASNCAMSPIRILKNQPSPIGSLFAIDGSARKSSLTSVTSPASGMKTSAAAFTDSTTPATSPCLYVRPTSGRSTNTTSPSASCACSVMPTTADSWSSSWIHSWSDVYLTVMLVLLWRSSAAVVTGRDEGHGAHLHRHQLAAHERVHRLADGGMVRRQVAHRDRLVERRGEQAAGDFAQAHAFGGLQFGGLAHRHAHLRDQADALARNGHRAIEMPEHLVGAREAAGTRATGAPHLLDRPRQRCFDRRGGRIDVVAVQAKAGFQPQRIARPQARGLHFVAREQGARHRFRLRR